MPKHYLFLIAAVVSEVIGTSALPASQQFTRFWPSAIVIAGYAAAFYFLSHVLKVMPVGVVYAIWSGMGVVLITVLGRLIYAQKIDVAAAIGMGLIIAGVVVIHLFSRVSAH